ncbi:MAG: TIGR02301 family protein [Ahrensia sp.]|nr:TIGR02301 family protein [Ahrensia sp.]
MRTHLILAILLGALLLPDTGFAQNAGQAFGPSRAEPAAPYDDKLLRLAEVLGSIHYLRNLCQSGEGNKWREIMSSLLVSERPGPNRREQLVAHFNRGYRAFDQIYGTCTPAAVAAAERYRQEGSALAGQITQRYGG